MFSFFSSRVLFCFLVFMGLVFVGLTYPLSVAAWKICHDNYATINFFYYPSKTPVDMNTYQLQSAKPVRLESWDVPTWEVSSGQACGGPIGVFGFGWNYRADTLEYFTDDLPIYSDSKNQVRLFYHCGRHKTKSVSEEFKKVSKDNPVLGLDIDEDQYMATYMPQKMNFWMMLSFNYLKLFKDPYNETGEIDVKIENLIFGQSSEGGLTTKIDLDIVKAFESTIYYFLTEGAASIGLAKAYSDLATDFLVGFKLPKNNWYVSQEPDPNLDKRSSYLTKFDGEDALVVRASGVDSDEGKHYPVIIVQGKDDHHFDAYIPTRKLSESIKVKEGSLESSPHIGNNNFLHESIGPFKRHAGTRWIKSHILGWLYPEEFNNETEWRWFYRNESDSWILINRQVPKYSYRELKNRIYEYDPQTMKFVLWEEWSPDEMPSELPEKPEKPERFDPSIIEN